MALDTVTAPRKRRPLERSEPAPPASAAEPSASPSGSFVHEASDRLDLATLPEELPTLAELISAAPRRTLGPGEALFLEGQPARSMFAVQGGALEITRASADQPIATVKAGEWLGLFGLLAKRRRAATATAVVTTEIAEIAAGPLVQRLTADAALRLTARHHFHERLATHVCGGHPLFQGLTRKERAKLAAAMTSLDLPADSHHVLVEEAGAALYVVAHGQVRLALPELSDSMPLSRGQLFGICAGSVALEAVTRVHLLQLSPAECPTDFLGELGSRARARGLLVDRQLFVGDVGLAGLA